MCYNKLMREKKFIVKASLLVSIIIFLVISVSLNATYIVAADNWAFGLVHYLRNDVTNNIFLIITLFGQTLTIIVILYFLWFLPNRKRVALPLSLCMLISSGINTLLKVIVNRARPVGEFVGNLIFNYGFPTSSSFPSGHSQAGVVFYYVLITILIKELNIKNKKVAKGLKTGAIILALLIGLSRIVLGVHFFSDVLTGLLTGWLIVIIFENVYQNYFTHKNLQKAIK